MKVSLLAGFFLLLLPGIALANRLEVGEGEAGKDLVLGRGDVLTVSLPANPTTGYSWRVTCVPAGLLKQVGESRFESSGHRQGMVGVGERQRWKFRAVLQGQASLVFSYVRPWEHDVAPARVIQWPITIRR